MNTPRDKSIGAQMHIATQLLKRRMQHRIQKLGLNITIEQLGLLEVLNLHGSMNMTGLAKHLVKENAVITRMVDILERERYVERKPSTNDRRAWEIHITTKGTSAFNKLIPAIIEEVKLATSCITKEEYDEAMRIIKKIIKHNQ